MRVAFFNRTLVFLFAFLMLTILFLTTPAFCQETKDWFPLDVGYWWIYQVGDLDIDMIVKITGKEKIGKYDCFVVEMGDTEGNTSSIEYYCKTGDSVLVVGEKDVKTGKKKIFETPQLYLKIPVKQGMKWTVSKEVTKDGTVREIKEVTGSDSMKIPAGSFKALKVVSIKKLSGKTAKNFELWYAPGVGVVKMRLKSNGEDLSMPLKEYSLKKM